MIYNAGLTVYNITVDPATRLEVLSRAYLPRCLYMASEGANVLKSGLTSADAAKIYITMDWLREADKHGVDPQHFTDPATQFTLTKGCIVVKGLAPADVTLKYLESNFGHVHLVTSVDIRDFGSPEMHHLEVGAK